MNYTQITHSQRLTAALLRFVYYAYRTPHEHRSEALPWSLGIAIGLLQRRGPKWRNTTRLRWTVPCFTAKPCEIGSVHGVLCAMPLIYTQVVINIITLWNCCWASIRWNNTTVFCGL